MYIISTIRLEESELTDARSMLVGFVRHRGYILLQARQQSNATCVPSGALQLPLLASTALLALLVLLLVSCATRGTLTTQGKKARDGTGTL